MRDKGLLTLLLITMLSQAIMFWINQDMAKTNDMLGRALAADNAALDKLEGRIRRMPMHMRKAFENGEYDNDDTGTSK
jgi:Zn-dependent protease with chaperone function